MIRDEQGADHHGYYDRNGSWHGGFYDDEHNFHEDPADWVRGREHVARKEGHGGDQYDQEMARTSVAFRVDIGAEETRNAGMMNAE